MYSSFLRVGSSYINDFPCKVFNWFKLVMRTFHVDLTVIVKAQVMFLTSETTSLNNTILT